MSSVRVMYHSSSPNTGSNSGGGRILKKKHLFIFLGRQPMIFYLCSGKDPSEQSDFPPKLNIPLIGAMAVSVLLQTGIQIKIAHSKRKTNPGLISNSSNLKLQFYNKFLNQSLSNFVTNILGVCIAVGTMSFVFIFNKFSQGEFNIFPNYYFVYALQMYVPIVFSSFLSLSHYYQNKPMRIFIKNELREKLSIYGPL